MMGYKKSNKTLNNLFDVSKTKQEIESKITSEASKILKSFGIDDFDVYCSDFGVKVYVYDTSINVNVIQALDDFMGAYSQIQSDGSGDLLLFYNQNSLSLDQTIF